MKRFFITQLAVLFCVPLFYSGVMAQTKAEQYLGQKENCVEVARIKETRILDDQTVLFEMRGGPIYINRFPVKCAGLKVAGGFGYATSFQKLCKQDRIKVTGRAGSQCPIGEFIEFKEKGTLSEVDKLLSNGLLKDLADENAFESAFPEKK